MSELAIRRLLQAIPLLMLAVMAGCTTLNTSAIDEDDRTSLVVVEVEGRVQMSWQSQPSRSYTILYSDRTNTSMDKWEPLPGYINMTGTGKVMTAQDKVPQGTTRQYRLRTNAGK